MNDSKGIARLNDFPLSAVAILIADTEKAIIDGCDKQMQLYDFASIISFFA